jgi:hypothetical protein
MKAGVFSVLLALTLVSSFLLPVLADDTGSITITMTGANEISITLNKTSWGPEDVEETGIVSSDTEYETDPPIEWCTLTVAGNCNVNTLIVGADAKWVDNPGAYKWTLSSDETNDDHIYVLWFRISGDTERGYVPIKKTEAEFWPPSGGSSLAPDDTKQFGLRLLTPTFFYGGREMKTTITVSAVAA